MRVAVGDHLTMPGMPARPEGAHTAASDVLARAPLGTALLVVQHMLGHKYATTTTQ
jgi:hypothetical protein